MTYYGPLKRARNRARAKRLEKGDYELPDDEKEDVWFNDHVRGGHPDNRMMYDPPENRRIPRSGAWIMILRRLPPIENGIDEKIRIGCCFWAVHSHDQTDENGFDAAGYYKVKLTTEWGDVWLWPYEYSVIATENILGCWQDGDLIFHPLRIDPATLNQQSFYARARGIPLATATVMALGSIQANIGWFEIHPNLSEAAEALSDSVHYWRPRSRNIKRKNPKPMRVSLDVGDSIAEEDLELED